MFGNTLLIVNPQAQSGRARNVPSTYIGLGGPEEEGT